MRELVIELHIIMQKCLLLLFTIAINTLHHIYRKYMYCFFLKTAPLAYGVQGIGNGSHVHKGRGRCQIKEMLCYAPV